MVLAVKGKDRTQHLKDQEATGPYDKDLQEGLSETGVLVVVHFLLEQHLMKIEP